MERMSIASERTEKLVRVRIEGFRSIAFTDLELRDVNVFVGANGAGKSSLIGFLQMLGSMMNESLPLFVNLQRGANAILHHGTQRTPRLVGGVEYGSNGAFSTYDFALIPAAGDRLLFAEELIVSQNFPDHAAPLREFEAGGTNSAVPKAGRQSEDFIERQMCHRLQSWLSKIKVFHFNNSMMTSPMRSLQNLRENRFMLSTGENTAVMLLRMKSEHPSNYQRIRGEMRRILPDFSDFVLEPEPWRGKEQVELRWTGRDVDYAFGPDQLSDGSIRAVSLLTLLLQPDEWKPGIIVIDEPELGLHPYAVGQIGRLIAEAGVTRQVIVSTQSPGLVAQFEPEDVVVVESENGASTFRRLDRESLGGWLEAYDGDLGRLFEMNITGGAPG